MDWTGKIRWMWWPSAISGADGPVSMDVFHTKLPTSGAASSNYCFLTAKLTMGFLEDYVEKLQFSAGGGLGWWGMFATFKLLNVLVQLLRNPSIQWAWMESKRPVSRNFDIRFENRFASESSKCLTSQLIFPFVFQNVPRFRCMFPYFVPVFMGFLCLLVEFVPEVY